MIGSVINGIAYVVKFKFENENISDERKEKLIEQFVELRAKAVDILNPKYERWNKEFGDVVITEENEEAYNQFIHKKHTPYLQIVNGKYGVDKDIVLLDDPKDGCDLYAVIKEDKTFIRAGLYPV